MREYCEVSKELEQLGKKVIKNHKGLKFIKDMEIRVGFVSSDKVKKNHDKITMAECHLVKPLFQAYIPLDFIIVFYEPNCIGLSEKQREILMYHELLHIGVNESGDMEYKIVPHDIEDFSTIIKRYGLEWNKVV